MKKCLHWLVVISTMLIPQIFFLPYQLSAKENALNAQKFVIKAGKESCVFRGTSSDVLRLPVLIGDCTLLSYEKPESMEWLRFPDGRIRAPNGLCLSARSGVAQAGKCSSKQFDAEESWVFAPEGEMKNKNNHCLTLMKGEDELRAILCGDIHESLQNTPLKFSLELDDDVQRQIHAAQYANTKINLLNSHRFSEIQSHFSDVSWKLADLITEIRQLKNIEKTIDSKQQEAENLVQAAKLHQDELATIHNFGNGVSVEVYDTQATEDVMPSVSFTLNRIDISPQLLGSYGVADKGPLAIKIKAFISAPRDGYYTLVARDLDTALSISVNKKPALILPLPPITNHVASAPIYLEKQKPVPIVLESHSIFGAPTFKLNWYSGDFDEKPVPSSYLFPDVLDESCAPKTRRLVDCRTTFKEFKENGSFQVLCPSGCVAESTAFGSEECYSLDSSICFAATAAGTLPDRGGVVTVTVTKKEKRPQYPAVESFNGIKTENRPEGIGCGRIQSYHAELGSPFRVTDVKLVDAKSLISTSSNPTSFAGYEGLISNADSVLLTKRGGGGKYITDIIMSCGQPQLDTGYEPVGGDIFIKRSQSENDPAISDAYIAFNEEREPLLFPFYDGWSRRTCGDSSLYLKYSTQSAPMDYASHSLSCEDTFDLPSISNSPLSSFVVRCPANCLSKKSPVFGLFLYDHQSSICRAAIHGGAISTTGGLVQVTRIEGLSARNGNEPITRNGITAFLTQSTSPSYYLTPPRGSLCSYPNVPILVHQNGYMKRAPVSFLEVTQKMNPAPPAAEVSKQEAALPHQVDRIMSRYNPPQLSTSPSEVLTPNLFSYPPYQVAVAYSPLYQTSLSSTFQQQTPKQNEFGANPTSMSSPSATSEAISQKNEDANKVTNKNVDKPIENKDESKSIGPSKEKKSFQQELSRFQEILLKEQHQLVALESQTLEIATKFDLVGVQVSDMHAEIAKIRNRQKERDGRRAEMLSSLEAVRDAFREKLTEKEGEIKLLEKALAKDSPTHSATFLELFNDLNVNNRYVTIDGEKSSFAPSNWRIKKVAGSGYAVTQDSGISSPKCFGTMAVVKDQNLSKGFVFADVLIPPGGGSVALLFKYVNSLNFKAFEISGFGVAQFRQMNNGIISPALGEIKIPPCSNRWVKIGVDFGQKNVRGFVDNKPITGMQIMQDPSVSDGGSFGIATNGVAGMAAFSKFIAGPLDKEAQAGPTAFGQISPKIATGKAIAVVANVGPQTAEENFDVRAPAALSMAPRSRINCTLPFKEELQTRLSENWMIQPNSGWSLAGDQNERFISGTNEARSSSFTANAIFLKQSALCARIGSVRIAVMIRLENHSRAGIVWRASSSTNFYVADIDTATRNAPKLAVMKIEGKTPYKFVTAQTQIEPKAFYKLEIFNNPSKVRVLLDGQPVMEETLPINEKDGQIGLIVLNGNAHFKDFELSEA